jgi:hypothetical protein
MLQFLLSTGLMGRAYSKGPDATVKAFALSLFVGTLALGAWALAPFALWKAWGIHWTLAWLLPTSAFIFMMGNRSEASYG